MTPDPRLDALGLVPRRYGRNGVSPDPTEALLAEAAREHAAAEERARRLCPDRAPGMIHPGFRDVATPDPGRPDPVEVAFALVVYLGAFASGAIVHAFGGWPASLAIGSACAGASVWALTGPAPNPLAECADEVIAVDSADTAVVQEVHLVVVHLVAAAVDHTWHDGPTRAQPVPA